MRRQLLLTFFTSLCLAALCAGCSPKRTIAPVDQMETDLHSILWVQKSSEYKAIAHQAYAAARANLPKVVKDKTVVAVAYPAGNYPALPPAVVLDLDETVLDNSRYNAERILEGSPFTQQSWDHWISLQQASAVPGSVNFINYARRAGVEVIYITNRACRQRKGESDICPQKTDTIQNMQHLGIKGIKPEHLLFKKEQQGWSSEKQSRRRLVSQKYRVVMLFGDDLGDFLPDVRKQTVEQRDQLVARHSDKWGTLWYMLPNPNYGSWWNVLEQPRSQYLNGYQ